VERAQALDDAVAADPPEQIGRLIAEARSGHEPAKAERVAALAQRLAAARRAQGQLDAVTARLERALAELDGAAPLAALHAALDDLEPAAAA
jgi:hypothetical protein